MTARTERLRRASLDAVPSIQQGQVEFSFSVFKDAQMGDLVCHG